MSQTEATSSTSTPSSPTTPSSPDVINKAAAKLCHIVKRPDFDGYGFNLHSEKSKPGQFIGKVDANSPAESAGLKEGDRIVEVNGMAINSETHKQVVQRIKAIACEVRLLLVDVDGKGDGHANGHHNNNDAATMEVSKTEQVLPGASDNINSITMVSTKRASQESQRSSSSTLTANGNGNGNGIDITDKAVAAAAAVVANANDDQHMMHNNNNIVPPPPSATKATVQKLGMPVPIPTPPVVNTAGVLTASTANTTKTTTTTTTTNGGVENGNVGGVAAAPAPAIKTGGLHLNMTAAEMRAKLMSKKKYDPKNESVDLKKKYEIVQKL